MYFVEPSAKPSGTSTETPNKSSKSSVTCETLLGTALSSLGGQYQIIWIQSPIVSQRLSLLANCSEAQIILKVLADSDNCLLATPPRSAASGPQTINISVPIPSETLSETNWSDIGKRMDSSSLQKISDLVNELVLTPVEKSIFRDWSIVLRQNAVEQIEMAFLDRTGILERIALLPAWQGLRTPDQQEAYQKLLGKNIRNADVQNAFDRLCKLATQFAGVFAIDWSVNTALFGHGAATALTANEVQYIGYHPPPRPVVNSHHEVGYRDYLRKQWTTMITMAGSPTVALTEQQAEEQLRNRFHQDFTTSSVDEQGVNEILIGIMTDILTSPSGGAFGFNMPSALIPSRGSATARSYLNSLIALSGVSAQELTFRYRTNFTRQDSVTSNSVWENIYTLQAFFRDSFQSVTDPSHTHPDVINNPIIPSLMQGKAPWFLQYGEWLLQQQPIWFENYFSIREIFKIDVREKTRNLIKDDASRPLSNAGLYQLYESAFELQDQLVTAFGYLDSNEYKEALATLTQLKIPIWLDQNAHLTGVASSVAISKEFANPASDVT